MTVVESRLTATERSFHVEAYEKIEYTLDYVDGVFDPANPQLADAFSAWGRCLAVVDRNVLAMRGEELRAYFEHHGIDLRVQEVRIAEVHKSLRTVEQLVDAFADFGLIRKEPVLVVGGGLTTDVAGFACAAYKRSTDYVRIPTTLIGLIDASVSIKVGANHGHLKNRLGAYHASKQVLLDFSFLGTLPTDQLRNGIAEIIKIATVGDADLFGRLEKYAEELLEHSFGFGPEGGHVREAGGAITYDAIKRMLELEVPNLHELDLDRVIAFGHTWSPTLELAPERPLFHGHAIAVDMAYSATLAARCGYITEADRDRVHSLFTRLGLSVDSPYLTPELIEQATASILQTRDGRLRAALPRPIGTCHFDSDLHVSDLVDALADHRALCSGLERGGVGLDAFTPAEVEAPVQRTS
ncbi:sedoheptulose 7-phosphate cyclase [Nocardioides acrostichi]|uniref:2-epi-5-epi-valiolone synthase n=1 Tax=Nocardioides acrostichi TaxID=2784339 RepID=A0A930USX8_9ACTN|nr:sedoheptulose 7-phosphate cyclase [Nocardioides acrostichi]MBF4160263.1 sedoheptulose 7-phosphate cyclase [Nocardioides acrostichi]